MLQQPLAGASPQGYMHTYPSRLVEAVTLADGTAVTIRPIRPEDARIEQEFVRNLSDESRYYRFMDTVRELSPRMLSHFTRIDYDRHMALIAVTGAGAAEKQIGVARYVAGPDRASCEFAIVVADGWQRKGLGTRLMRALINAARAAGVRTMYGEALATNSRMLRFAAKLGFTVHFDTNDARMMRLEMAL